MGYMDYVWDVRQAKKSKTVIDIQYYKYKKKCSSKRDNELRDICETNEDFRKYEEFQVIEGIKETKEFDTYELAWDYIISEFDKKRSVNWTWYDVKWMCNEELVEYVDCDRHMFDTTQTASVYIRVDRDLIKPYKRWSPTFEKWVRVKRGEDDRIMNRLKLIHGY